MAVDNMVLRDHFAGLALTGLLTTPMEGEIDPKTIASMAYEFADAMMDEKFKAFPQAERERAERRRQIHADEQARKAAASRQGGA